MDALNVANNTAELIASIQYQIPGWLDGKSIFDSERQRLVNLAITLDEVEEDQDWDWGNVGDGWEDACSRLVEHFFSYYPREPITVQTVRTVLLRDYG